MNRYDYATSAELFVIDTLKCSEEDLENLDYLYSKLVEDLRIDTREYVKKPYIQDIMQDLFTEVSSKIATELYCVEGYQSVLDRNNDTVIEFKVTEDIYEQIKKYVEVLENCKPEFKEGTWYFNNLLDKVIDWDYCAESVVRDIIQALYEEGMLKIKEESLVR